MNGVTKSVILALAVTALPLAATAAEKSGASKDWPTFKKVDADNSGMISQDEARAVSGLSDTMTSYDKNGDGQLSSSEYESAKKAAKSSGGGSSSGSSSGSSGAAGGTSGSGSR